jgi:hypothetical protein
MANFIGELLFAVIRGLVMEWAYALWVKVATWLDKRIHGRLTRIVAIVVLGVAGFFLFPVIAGLLSF